MKISGQVGAGAPAASQAHDSTGHRHIEGTRSMDAAETLKGAAETLTDHSRKNLEAIVASASAAAKGAEALGAEAAAYSRSFLETQVATAKAVAAAKTPHEAFEAQAAFARGAFESYVSELGKVGELFAAAWRESATPLSARVGEVVGALQAAR